jgi:hypothetical protein
MDSIFSKINLPGIPVDLLATLRIFFEQGTLQNKTLFEQSYVDRWFTYNLPQMGLTCEAIMASYKVRFMASVIGNDAATPLRPSDGFKTFSEEIPRMGHKFPMSAKKLRKMLEVLEMSKRYTDQQKFNEVYKMLMGDVREAYMGCKDTADHIILQSLSNGGVAQFTPTLNNPDGRAYKVDYQMPDANKKKANANWEDANKNTVNPFEELQAIKLEFEQAGIAFGEMLITPALYAWIISCPAVKKAILGTDKSGGVVTDAQLRDTLSQYDLPPFTKVVKRNAIQKDGKRVAQLVNPWNENMIVFKPAGTIGEVQPAFEDNEIIPEPSVSYIDAGNGIRVAKWQVGESTGQLAGEYTQASWRALPIITDIAGVVNYQVRGIA